MDIGAATEKMMGMDDEIWLRHANPLSGWTRLGAAPFWFLAAWSYVWIGWWALAPIALLIVWTWLNPRIFPMPRNTNAWMTKGVLGERVWLNRKSIPIAKGHARAALITTTVSGVTVLIAAYGLIVKDFWAAFLGWHFSVFAKLWFLDRMVWLWEDMKGADPLYRAWEEKLNRA